MARLYTAFASHAVGTQCLARGVTWQVASRVCHNAHRRDDRVISTNIRDAWDDERASPYVYGESAGY